MTNNSSLRKAVVTKADEFYTQLSDIEAEMRYYKEQLRDKIIFCNCDDPYESNFFKYFALNFNHLGIKKLIATSYTDSPVVGLQLPLFDITALNTKPANSKQAYKIEITEVTDENADGAVDLADVEYLLKNKNNLLTILTGDGDFRSPECIEMLKEADIVVTNPPFSLFRDYLAQLMEYNKRFIIIGNKNSITYKEIFTYISENKLRTGYRNINSDMWFIVPDHYEYEKIQDGNKVKHMSVCWFTNLDVKKHDEFLILYKKYTPEEFPHYDNYDAIEVSKVDEIPCDYYGVMGVPITFLDKYNPEQFEIIGLAADKRDEGSINIKGTPTYLDSQHTSFVGMVLKGKATYARIIIRRKGA